MPAFAGRTSPQNFSASRFMRLSDDSGVAILSLMPKLKCLCHPLLTTFDLLLDALRFIRLGLQPNWALAAENLFLRKIGAISGGQGQASPSNCCHLLKGPVAVG